MINSYLISVPFWKCVQIDPNYSYVCHDLTLTVIRRLASCTSLFNLVIIQSESIYRVYTLFPRVIALPIALCSPYNLICPAGIGCRLFDHFVSVHRESACNLWKIKQKDIYTTETGHCEGYLSSILPLFTVLITCRYSCKQKRKLFPRSSLRQS